MRRLIVFFLSLVMAVPAACAPDAGLRVEYAYGADPAQRFDFWRGKVKDAPLILFIHGGGWSKGDKRNATGIKADYYAGLGYAFASVNYRLVPDATVEDQAADIASAIAYARSHAAELGIDGRKIILMGHSAGAHLAALVATDPAWLKGASVPMDAVRGVVLLDGAAYQVPSGIDVGPRLIARMRSNAFGMERDRQMRLSPTIHAASPNAASFLILYVDRPGAHAQAEGLAKALANAGTPATVHEIANSNHMQLNRNLGKAGDPATKLVDDYLARVVGARSQ